MRKVAKFEKVSFKKYKEAWFDSVDSATKEDFIIENYNDIVLPKRATVGSAGYDFYTPFSFHLNPGETIKIPTGIRVNIGTGWVLKLYPRSSLGFKYRLWLDNCVGIIDEDYYYSDNEGHIFAKITNNSKDGKTVVIKQGEAFMQGIFVEYGITYDDKANGIRNGGLGSTNYKLND